MTVAFDAFSRPASVTSGNISWTHTPVGTPKAVWVPIAEDNDNGAVTAVTYGGVALARTTDSPQRRDAGIDTSADGWFLGSGIPSGPQTVSVTADGFARLAGCITLTATGDTEVVDTAASNADTANPSAGLVLGGNACWCGLVCTAVQDSADDFAPLSGWTARAEEVLNAVAPTAGVIYSYDTVGSSDVTAGLTMAAAEHVMIAIAIRDLGGGGGGSSILKQMIQHYYG